MEVFFFIAIYGMPVLAFLFIVVLLRAIKKIIKGKSYNAELFWAGLLFASIVWTLAIIPLLASK